MHRAVPAVLMALLSLGSSCAPKPVPPTPAAEPALAQPAPSPAVPAPPPAAQPKPAPRYAFRAKPGDLLDLGQGRPIEPSELGARLTGVRLVFIGEAHDEPSSRKFAIQVIETLLAQEREAFVALEMFPPEANAVLDEWIRGNLGEKEFLERSGWYEHWGFPWSTYRELFLLLRERRLPARGINVTREQRRQGGEGKLDPALREELGELDLAVEPHRRYLSDALAEAEHPGVPPYDSPEFERFLRIQVLWDHAMGVRAARLARAGSGRAAVVAILGAGHLEYKLGANLRAARARPDLPQITLLDRFVTGRDLRNGFAEVPLGLADLVRVDRYTEEAEKPGSISNMRLAAAAGGIRIESIRAFAGGAYSGLKAGDLIRSLNGKAYTDPIDLRLAYEAIPPTGFADWMLARNGATVAWSTPIHPKR